MSSQLLNETQCLEGICLQMLRANDVKHSAEELEVLARRIHLFAVATAGIDCDAHRYDSYQRIQRKIEILVEAFKHIYHPEDHSLSENLGFFEDYVRGTYGGNGKQVA